MSCRIASVDHAVKTRQVRWPELSIAPTPVAPPAEFELARAALSESVEQTDSLRQQLAETELELARREQAGYERGLAEGLTRGCQEATEQQKPVLERMSRSIADVAMLRPKLRMQTEADLVQLSLAIARHVLKHELRSDALALEGIVRAALQRCGAEEVCRIRAHPSQAQPIREQLNKLGVPESVRVDGVVTMTEGDLVIETSGGALDASVNTQMEEIERGLATRLGAE